jgi:hypothetical protein
VYAFEPKSVLNEDGAFSRHSPRYISQSLKVYVNQTMRQDANALKSDSTLKLKIFRVFLGSVE